MTHPPPARTTFGEPNFGSAQLGNALRTQRLVQLADALAAHPSGSLPDKLAHPPDLRAFYRLVNQDAVTHAAVLTPPYQRTRARMAACADVVLLLQDTTELDYTGLTSLADDLGPIGNGRRKGYRCHNVLAVVAGTREVLGLAHQQLYCRPPAQRGETRAQRRGKKDRESRLWKQARAAIGAAPPGPLWVEVGDRGSDWFEYLAALHHHGKH